MLPLVGILGGCVETTQQKNARAQLHADRLLASRSPVRVTRADPNVAVLKVSTLRSPAGTAIAVTLRNDGARPVSDLPVSVGVKTSSGRTTYLNRHPELPYLQTHVAGIGPHSRVTWVFSATRAIPNGQAVARVGVSAIALERAATQLPTIASSVTSVRSRGRGRSILAVQVTNRSEVPQDDLEVYAYALSGDRLVAGGTALLGSLGAGAREAVQIPLVGKPAASTVRLETPPTNLR